MDDITVEFSRLYENQYKLNSSIEKLSLAIEQREIKKRYLSDSTVDNVKSVILPSLTSTTEVSIEDIDSSPYIALQVSIESDDNFIMRILKAIRDFFLNIYKSILKIFRWIGEKIGLVDKAFEEAKKEALGKKGVLKVKNKKYLDPERSSILFDNMKTLFIASSALKFSVVNTYLYDIGHLHKFIDTINNDISKNRDKLTLVLSLDFIKHIESYKFIKRTELLAMVADSKDQANLIPNERLQKGEIFDHILPIRLDKDNINMLYLTPTDPKTKVRQLKYYKGKLSDKIYENADVAIYGWALIQKLIDNRNTIESSKVVSASEKAMETLSKTIEATLKKIEEEMKSKDSEKVKEIVTPLREASKSLAIAIPDIPYAFKGGLEAINEIIFTMLNEYE